MDDQYNCFHKFDQQIAGIDLPEHFTYPFHYTPHPLCVIAAQTVQEYLKMRTDWAEELQQGKMFGVLVVRTKKGELGFLAAFSGILAGKNRHSFFVPPVYDLLNPDGFFKMEEACISQINHRIEAFRLNPEYAKLIDTQKTQEYQREQELNMARRKMAEAKSDRDYVRSTKELTTAEQDEMIRESQYQKAEYKRLEKRWQARLEECRKQIRVYEQQLEIWKQERKQRSAELQRRLFSQFRMLNARGEEKDLCQIFAEDGRSMPPAGAGECAAPKLLQYAYLHDMHPLAMAEFWWGDSPKTEVRHQGYYYPSCKSKCEPILRHMLKGLDVEANPLQLSASLRRVPEIVWEDDSFLIVDKPAGLLSVPGKDISYSVWEWMHERYPDADGPLVVHRLDMDTSGLLVLAKHKEIHALLQNLFETRVVKKRYIAMLDGYVGTKSGFIRLPLCLNPDDRPRQMVSEEYGKPAVTRFEVLGYESGCTRVAFYPQTGRTHQLRVHAAHVHGLNAPIVGDPLYGKPADRLYLHAEMLEFRHPVTNKWLKVEKKAPF